MDLQLFEFEQKIKSLVRVLNQQDLLFYAVACLISLRRVSNNKRLQEDTYFRVMRILEEKPDVTQREIAHKLGISTSGLNYALNALIGKGWVKVYNFSESKNKFGYVYLLTPSGVVEKAYLASRFLQRKLQEYEEMKTEIESLRTEMLNSNLSTNIISIEKI